MIVKCASITVTCKGTPGPAGPQGAPGTNGTNGSTVVLRARGTVPSVAAGKESIPPGCMSFTCLEGANVPVSPNTWTEGSTEDDQMIGSATISLPSNTACGDENSKKEFEDAFVYLIASVNGTVEGLTAAGGSTTARTSTVSLFGPSILRFEFEEEEGGSLGTGFFIGNGSSQSHAITVEAIDNCPGTPVTVSNVAIDVLGSV